MEMEPISSCHLPDASSPQRPQDTSRGSIALSLRPETPDTKPFSKEEVMAPPVSCNDVESNVEPEPEHEMEASPTAFLSPVSSRLKEGCDEMVIDSESESEQVATGSKGVFGPNSWPVAVKNSRGRVFTDCQDDATYKAYVRLAFAATLEDPRYMGDTDIEMSLGQEVTESQKKYRATQTHAGIIQSNRQTISFTSFFRHHMIDQLNLLFDRDDYKHKQFAKVTRELFCIHYPCLSAKARADIERLLLINTPIFPFVDDDNNIVACLNLSTHNLVFIEDGESVSIRNISANIGEKAMTLSSIHFALLRSILSLYNMDHYLPDSNPDRILLKNLIDDQMYQKNIEQKDLNK